MYKISIIICLFFIFYILKNIFNIFTYPEEVNKETALKPRILNQEGSLVISKDLLMITFVHLVRNFSQVSGGKGSSTRNPRLRTLM